VADAQRRASTQGREAIFDVRDLSIFYGAAEAVSGVTMQIHRNLVTAIIGPPAAARRHFCAASTA